MARLAIHLLGGFRVELDGRPVYGFETDKARITGGQLTAGGALQLDITGSASHSHAVSLSAGEVMAIAGGAQVSKQSSTSSGHDHTVTFN